MLVEVTGVVGLGATTGVELDVDAGLGVVELGAAGPTVAAGLEEGWETLETGEVERVDCEAEADAIRNACK